MIFKIGDIVEIHGLVNYAQYNGTEGTVAVVFNAGDWIDYKGRGGFAPESGYLLELSNEFVCVGAPYVRRPKEPGDQSADQIWNDLIHRLTQGVPA